MRRLLFLIPAALLPACLIPTEYDEDLFDVTEAVTAVEVTTVTGDVQVRGGEGDSVHVEADLRWTGEQPKVTWDVQSGVLVVEVECDEPTWFCTVDLALDVPRGVAVEVKSTTGDVSVRDVDGDVVARTTTGDATLTDLVGALAVDVTTGQVVGRGLESPTVAVTVTTGDIDLVHQDDFTRIVAATTTGHVRILVPGGTYDVTAENSTGTVEITGLVDDPDATSEIIATTTTGNIEVTGYTVSP